MREYPSGLTPEQAFERMKELTDSIDRCKRLNIVEMIPDLEKERTLLRDTYLRQAYP